MITNNQLAEIASKDCLRIRAHIYKLAGRGDDLCQPRPRGQQEWRLRDVGARILMSCGFEQFHAYYLCALNNLYESHVVQHLREGGYLDIEFHFSYDSGDNCYGDWGWFQWQIVRAYEVS